MKIISIDRTQRSIPVQTPSRKFRGSLCSLPRELTKVTPSGVKVNLAEKIIFFILLISAPPAHLLGSWGSNLKCTICEMKILPYNSMCTVTIQNIGRYKINPSFKMAKCNNGC